MGDLRIAMLVAIATLSVGASAQEHKATQSDPAAAMPAWMAGCWLQEKESSWTEECWTAPRGGVMLGSGRNGRGERVRSWETLQILADSKSETGDPVPLAYWAAPGGGARTMFQWKADGGPGVSFYNEAHDYPQRIRYWREGDDLMAEISLADGSKAVHWRYRPIR